jgi:uncharacterized SAM-binding protein YcdF (DUF218 family)
MAKITKEVNQLAKIIWDYHLMNHKIEKADLIMVMGSHDLIVAERGVELYLQGWAPLVVMSGGLGLLTTKFWNRPEAEIFSKVAIKAGVPKDRIIIERESTNTGENVIYTRKLLNKLNINPKKIILVQKPYMERRAYATFKKFWPEVRVIVTSPQLPFEKYNSKTVNREKMISIVVGDLQRIKKYPKLGYQIYQKIPERVWSAYEELVKMGYTSHLIK